MAAKGTLAKANVIKKIAAAFGEDYVGEVGGKAYVMANDGAGKVQIAIALTCPKTPIEIDGSAPMVDGGLDFNAMDNAGMQEALNAFKPAEITEEEMNNIADLLASLGL